MNTRSILFLLAIISPFLALTPVRIIIIRLSHISIPSIKTFCESNQVNIDYNYLETSPLHKLLSNAKYDLPDSTLGELIEYFVEKGVPINSKDELKFETPLDLVSESTRPVIYQVLLSNGGKLGKYC
jgi:hypothetical protein